MSHVLKPCPFCGGNPWERVEGGSIIIACHKCGAAITRMLVPAAMWETVPPKARKAWNLRTPDSQPEGR